MNVGEFIGITINRISKSDFVLNQALIWIIAPKVHEGLPSLNLFGWLVTNS